MGNEEIMSKLKYIDLLIKKTSKKYDYYLKEKDEENKDTLYLAISKLIEELIETATNINNLLLEEKGDFAESYYLSFVKLKRHYKINPEFLKKISLTSRFRNKVVHNYSSLEEEFVIEKTKEIIRLYEEYKEIILNFLKSKK
jgi:uncharacterized protein YutE (UPF0331/DUF86 family)